MKITHSLISQSAIEPYALYRCCAHVTQTQFVHCVFNCNLQTSTQHMSPRYMKLQCTFLFFLSVFDEKCSDEMSQDYYFPNQKIPRIFPCEHEILVPSNIPRMTAHVLTCLRWTSCKWPVDPHGLLSSPIRLSENASTLTYFQTPR